MSEKHEQKRVDARGSPEQAAASKSEQSRTAKAVTSPTKKRSNEAHHCAAAHAVRAFERSKSPSNSRRLRLRKPQLSGFRPGLRLHLAEPRRCGADVQH